MNITVKISFKNSTLTSTLCDYRNLYIYVKVNMTISKAAAAGAATNNANKKVII